MNVTRTQQCLALAGSLTGLLSVMIGIGMIYDGFVPQWDTAVHDWTRDPRQGIYGIIVVVSGIVAFGYGRLVHGRASRTESEPASDQKRILVPGDPDFHGEWKRA